MTQATKRALLIGGVSTVKGRIKLAGPSIVAVCDEFEPILQAEGYLANAPFDTVSLVFRFGEAEDLDPEIDKINKRHNELPVAISFSMEELSAMDQVNLTEKFRASVIEVLCDVAANFDLPYEFLDQMRR
jgi:Immunity protein 39